MCVISCGPSCLQGLTLYSEASFPHVPEPYPPSWQPSAPGKDNSIVFSFSSDFPWGLKGQESMVLINAVTDWECCWIYVQTLIRDKLGLEPDPDLDDSLPKNPGKVNELLEKLAKRGAQVPNRIGTTRCNHDLCIFVRPCLFHQTAPRCAIALK